MRTVTLFEHENASVAEVGADTQFTVPEINYLDRAQKSQGVEAFRWISRTQVKAAQYVGMIASEDIRLEILPKIDNSDKGSTRAYLMRMIAAAWDLPVWDGEAANHDYQNSDLLELLIRLFAQRLLQQTRAGLHRAYLGQESDLSRLRGKMNVTRQFTRLAAQPQVLACRYEEFTSDNPLNRLLLCAVAFLTRRSRQSETQRLLSEIRSHFEDVSEIPVRIALEQKFTLDRTNRRWALPATLARLFLSSSYQTAHGDAHQGISLLFDMNVLFEAYVAALVRRTCIPLGYRVHTQGPRRHLARSIGNRGAFQTKPDLTLERDGVVVIADTKWKRLDPGRPYFDVSQPDAYQMHGYAHVYAGKAAILIYPHHAGLSSEPGQQAHWRFIAGDAALRVVTLDVANPAAFTNGLQSLLSSDVSLANA